MSENLFICYREEIDDPGSRGFNTNVNGSIIDGFVVHKDGAYYAYRNKCPHTGSPLDWVEHQFLDLDLSNIQCAVHDARFEVESGLCIAGPCPGESLIKLGIEQREQALYLIPPEA